MQYIDILTGEYPIGRAAICKSYPNVSLPKDVEEFEGYRLVHQTQQPEYDKSLFRCVEGAPYERDGKFYQIWELVPFTPEELSTVQAQAAERLKLQFSRYAQTALDSFARAKGYDSILAACSYLGSTNPVYAAEAAKCVEARDVVWSAVSSAQGATLDELTAHLPVLSWGE